MAIWGELSKNYLIAFCPHVDYMVLQNLEPLALMVSDQHCLDMTDRRTWLKRFFSSRWSIIRILYTVSNVSFALLHTFCRNQYALFSGFKISKKDNFSIANFSKTRTKLWKTKYAAFIQKNQITIIGRNFWSNNLVVAPCYRKTEKIRIFLESNI